MKLFKRKQKFNAEEALGKLVFDLNENFNGIGADYDELREALQTMSTDFYELRQELATNGVVRDLRALEKKHQETLDNFLRLVDYINDRFEQIDNNDTTRAVDHLAASVYGSRKGEQVTLKGKVDAIIDHLGIDISVKPEEVKVTEAQVVVKKAKKGKK